MQNIARYNIKNRVGVKPTLFFIIQDSVLEIRSSSGCTCGSFGKVLTI